MVQRIRQLASILFVGSAIAMTCISSSQRLSTKSRPRLNGEITFMVAADKARDLLDLLGLPQDARSDTVARIALNFRTEAERYWDIQSPRYLFSVLSRTGRVAMFCHLERQGQQYRGRGRTGIRYVRTEQEARQKLTALATRLGIMPSCQIGTVKLKFDGQVKDKNSAGYFGATFLRNGAVAATISCDIQDGVPTCIQFADEYRD